ncbi:putative signal transducing protein [Ketobacter alkanivorans]|uniref:DUF2007 domain-containing protein n=1 Tax=Ketobacter alkanivorans TaxID=1917421 RepID=A0A2K9LMQ9_9GAMM|nr:DUF2007 domain-containing protein [Ketobacter alkanivorans]AUM13530.1 hypothetical protein Kalk_14350 [Ketobacter alkanivorans]MCP5018173.1 DUF2007 domain-containing protein [Ketobacter sp.]
MQIIYKARDITEAHIVAGLLRSNGIESHVGGHYLQGGVGELGMNDFAVIRVSNDNIAAARTLITQYEQQAYPERSTQQKTIESPNLSALFAITLFLVSVVILIALVG